MNDKHLEFLVLLCSVKNNRNFCDEDAAGSSAPSGFFKWQTYNAQDSSIRVFAS